MISEFSVKLSPTNKKAKYYSIGCMISSFLMFIVYVMIEQYKGLVGLVIIGLMTAGIYIYTRYVSTELLLDITFDGDGTPVLVVRQLTGKRYSTLSRVELHSIAKIEKLEGDALKSHKAEAGYLKYTYTPTLFPEKMYLLVIRSRYEKAEMLLECGDDFAAFLLSQVREAKELYPDTEEM